MRNYTVRNVLTAWRYFHRRKNVFNRTGYAHIAFQSDVVLEQIL